jgi:hypothetical protein
LVANADASASSSPRIIATNGPSPSSVVVPVAVIFSESARRLAP